MAAVWPDYRNFRPRRQLRRRLRLFAMVPLHLLLPLLAMLMPLPPPPQTPGEPAAARFWQEVPAAQVRRLGPARFRPARARVLTLDLPALRAALAPADAATGPTLPLPLPEGGWQPFQLRTSPTMAPALAAKYPELRTYAGQSPTAAADYVRLEITPTGLHAQLVQRGRTLLIEPYRAGDTRHYLCFDKAALPAGSKAAFELPGGPGR